MALFNTSLISAGSSLGIRVKDLSDVLEANEESIYSEDAGLAYLGLESASAPNSQSESVDKVKAQFKNITKLLTTVGVEHDGAPKVLTEPQKEAAARTAMLYSNVGELNTKMKKLGKHLNLDNVGTESFTRDRRDGVRDYAIALAIAGANARRSAGEVVYPTMQLNADFLSTRITLPRFEFLGQQYHTGTGGDITDWKERHLADAGRVSGLLNRNDNKMVPRVVDGSNENQLLPEAMYPYKKITATDGSTFETGLINGQFDGEINLLQLSRAPGQNSSNTLTINDRIDDGVVLKSMYIGFGAGNHIMEFRTSDMSNAYFSQLEANSSNSKRNLAMDGVEWLIDLTTAKAQAIPELLALHTAGYSYIKLAITLNMSIDLHKGTLSKQQHDVKLIGVYQAKDGDNFVADNTISTEVGNVNPQYRAPVFDMSLSSKTQRMTGLRVRANSITKTYSLLAQQPITAEEAIDADNVDLELAAMNTARNLAKEDAAITHYLRTINEMCEKFGTDGKNIPDYQQSQYAGVFYLVKPWCKDGGEVDAGDVVKEFETEERAAKLASFLSGMLSENLSMMVTESGLTTPLKEYAGGTAKIKPTVVAGNTISRYAKTYGDEEFLGNLDPNVFAKPEVVVSDLDVMDNLITIIPNVVSASGESDKAFGFGYCIETPPLVFDVGIQESGELKRRLQIQPFFNFVTNMPLVYMVKVVGVEAWLSS